jgi:hypothetical protein
MKSGISSDVPDNGTLSSHEWKSNTMKEIIETFIRQQTLQRTRKQIGD